MSPCTCPTAQGYPIHTHDCPECARFVPPAPRQTRDHTGLPYGTNRADQDAEPCDPRGRMADAEAARIYGGSDVD